MLGGEVVVCASPAKNDFIHIFFYVAKVFVIEGFGGPFVGIVVSTASSTTVKKKAAQTPPLHPTKKKGRKVFRRVYLRGWQFLEHYKK